MTDPTPTEDAYRVAAEAMMRFDGRGAVNHLRAEQITHLVGKWWDTPDLRAAVDAVRPLFEAAGREAAAQAIESSDEWWPADDPIGIVTRAAEIARGDQ